MSDKISEFEHKMMDECEKVAKKLKCCGDSNCAEAFGEGAGFASMDILEFSRKWWSKLEPNSDGTIDDEETFLEDLAIYLGANYL